MHRRRRWDPYDICGEQYSRSLSSSTAPFARQSRSTRARAPPLAPLSRPIAKSLFCGEGSFSLNESAIKRRWRWGWCVCMGAGGPHCASKSATIPSFYSFLCCLIGVCGAAVSPRSFGHGHLLCVSFVSRLAAYTCFLAPFKNLIFENATLVKNELHCFVAVLAKYTYNNN